MKRAIGAWALALAACGAGPAPALWALDEEGAPVRLALPLAEPFRDPAGAPRAVLVGNPAPFRGLRVLLGGEGEGAWRVACFKPTTPERPWASWEALEVAREGAPAGALLLRWDLPASPPCEAGSLGGEPAFWVSLSPAAAGPWPAILSVEVVP